MQRDPADLARRWLAQAASDLDAARRTADAGIAYLACFLAQQGAEKALKGVLLWTTGDHPRIHEIATLLDELPPERRPTPDLAGAARTLDKFYTTTRYPDALDFALPSQSFSDAEARLAIGVAAEILDFAGTVVPARPDDGYASGK